MENITVIIPKQKWNSKKYMSENCYLAEQLEGMGYNDARIGGTIAFIGNILYDISPNFIENLESNIESQNVTVILTPRL